MVRCVEVFEIRSWIYFYLVDVVHQEVIPNGSDRLVIHCGAFSAVVLRCLLVCRRMSLLVVVHVDRCC